MFSTKKVLIMASKFSTIGSLCTPPPMSFPMSHPFFQLTKHFQHLCHTLIHTSCPLQTPPTMPPQPACTWLGQNSNGHTHPMHIPTCPAYCSQQLHTLHACTSYHTHTNSIQTVCTLGTMPCTPCTTSHTNHQVVQQYISHSHQPHTKTQLYSNPRQSPFVKRQGRGAW